MPRIPLSLVIGFLGSGKTTFLKQTVGRLAHRRIVYIINDFSALDIDGAVLADLGANIVPVPGGSIFCKCLVGEFIEVLSDIPRRFHLPGRALDGVIVEASGIADPRVVADLLHETKLDAVYDLASIVAVADPDSIHKLLATLPNIRSQIEAADTVLLNKTDLSDERRIAAAEEAMGRINPRAQILRTVHAAAEVELFDAAPTRDLHGEYAGCIDPHYARFSVEFRRPVDLARLQIALTQLAGDLYRVKGFAPTPAGTVHLDFSAGGLSVNAWHRSLGEQPGLAIIAPADRCEAMEAFIDEVETGIFDAL